jgi:transcriptional regulator with XRE-family HTH domain
MNIDPLRRKRAMELKLMRVQKKLTQDKLSELSGLDKKTISNLESGESGWNVDSEIMYLEGLKKIA